MMTLGEIRRKKGRYPNISFAGKLAIEKINRGPESDFGRTKDGADSEIEAEMRQVMCY